MGTGQHEDWESVAEAIRQRMQELRMTQLEVASKAGVSLATIQELVRPLARNRQPRTLEAISLALDWPPGYIAAVLHGDELPSESTHEEGDVAHLGEQVRALKTEVREIAERLDSVVVPASEISQLHEEVGLLRAHLIDLYARTGQPYPQDGGRVDRQTGRHEQTG